MLCSNGLQVYLFVMNESATLVQSGRPAIRFADVYHSANRTPVSSSEVACFKGKWEADCWGPCGFVLYIRGFMSYVTMFEGCLTKLN